MPWPSSPGFVTTHLDAGTDSPASARGDLKAALDDLGSVIAGRGQASGVASLDAATRVPLVQLPVIPIANGMQAWQAAGSNTFTVPAGVTRLKVSAWGAGGGGGYTTNGAGIHGGGGGAGGGAIHLFTVTPGDSVSVVVGAGGAGVAPGPADADGGAGGDTTVTHSPSSTTIVAKGGSGGKGATNSSFGGAGGATTSGSAASLHLEGGVGQSGDTARGGIGGSNGMTGSAPATAGFGFGGGGYGGGGTGGGSAGRDGGVLIEW